MSIIVLLAVVVGGLLGALLLPPEAVANLDKIIETALCLMLVGVGIDLGSQREAWRRLAKMGFKILLVPLFVVLGTLGGVIIAGWLLQLPLKEATAIGAGFGWYSLSGVILTKLHGVETGALAFLTNVARELLTFILVPVLAARLGKLSAVATGGATTMDSTLPLIARCTDSHTAVIALINGVVLSSLVPILVPLLMSL